MRIGEDKKPKRYSMWKPKGKRPVGWPQKWWIGGVKAVLDNGGTQCRRLKQLKDITTDGAGPYWSEG